MTIMEDNHTDLPPEEVLGHEAGHFLGVDDIRPTRTT